MNLTIDEYMRPHVERAMNLILAAAIAYEQQGDDAVPVQCEARNASGSGRCVRQSTAVVNDRSVCAHHARWAEAQPTSVDSAPAHGIARPSVPGYEVFDGRHPCEFVGCDHSVQFDDEPYCFTHSPDEGSSVKGYSFKAKHADAIANRLWG